MPLVDAARHIALDALFRGTAPASNFTHFSLHTAWSATGTNEVTGGAPAYARQSGTFAAPTGGSTDAGAGGPYTFDVPSGNVHFIGMFTAVTAGTFLGMTIANSSSPVAFQLLDTVNDDFVSENHGLSADDRIVFHPSRGATLPAGVTEGTIYFVITAGLTTDQFRVSTTSEGSALPVTADGRGVYQIGTPETFAGQGQYTITDFDADLLA